MMKSKPSLITGWLLAAAVTLSFFMPWARFAPESIVKHSLAVSRHLVEEKGDFWHNYVLMRSEEAGALLRKPGEGLSAYQLVLLAEEKTWKSKIERAFLEMLWGEKKSRWKIKFLLVAPACAITAAFLLSRAKLNRKMLLCVALVQAGFYCFFRWKLNVTYLDRLVGQVDFNWGLWLCLYTTALMALLVLIRVLVPDRYKW